jgi:rare lipoprotein A
VAAAPTEPKVAEIRPAPQPAAANPAVTPVAAPSPAAAPPPAKIPIDVEKSGIYLQLGAFSARDNAENFRVRMSQQLSALDKAVEVYQRDGLFRLHLGPYRDRAEANAAAEQIREALAFKPVVILK